MKRCRYPWSILLAATLGLGGCVAVPVHEDDGYGYYEDETLILTPPPRVEYRGYAPAAGYLWIDGYWAGDRDHRWVPGYWAPPGSRHLRPHPHEKKFERERAQRPAWIRDRDRDGDHGRGREPERRRDDARERDPRPAWLHQRDDDGERRRDHARERDARPASMHERERDDGGERRRERTREDGRDRERPWAGPRPSGVAPRFSAPDSRPAHAPTRDADRHGPRERHVDRDSRHSPPPDLIRIRDQRPAQADAPSAREQHAPRREPRADHDGRPGEERGRAERAGGRSRDEPR